MAERRTLSGKFHDELRLVRDPAAASHPPPTDRELDRVAAELGTTLPHGYREFMKFAGCGTLADNLFLHPVTELPSCTAQSWIPESIRTLTRMQRKTHSHYRGIAQLVYFGHHTFLGMYAWDPGAVSCSDPFECKIYRQMYDTDNRAVEVGETFYGFINRYLTSNPSAGAVMDDGRIVFRQLGARWKKVPRKREVACWLTRNNSAVLTLAQSIRDTRLMEELLVLGDALEEAGCTNVDMLESCRSGVPEIDGAWVLQVLLDDYRWVTA